MSGADETEDLFPSGRWLGWQRCGDHGQIVHRLNLTFESGRISGSTYEGKRLIPISGTYDPETLDCLIQLDCGPGDMDRFRGFREGKGIWGTWTCPVWRCTGGFLIWPYREGGEEEREEAAEGTPWTSTEPTTSIAALTGTAIRNEVFAWK